MVKTPKELQRMVTETDRKELQSLERRIDEVLVEDFSEDNRSITVSTPYLNQRVRREISRIYEEAGWNVKYGSDQREGDWITLTPKLNWAVNPPLYDYQR